MAVTITLPVLAVAIVLYLVLNPDKAEKLAGRVWRGVARVFSFGEQRAVAYSVQGDINTLIYTEKCDVVYLMARDHNIDAVKALQDDLKSDGLIEQTDAYEYPLRSDFKSRIMHRERAIIVVLHRKIGVGERALDEADVAAPGDEEIEVYEPSREGGVEGEQGQHAPAPVPES